MGEQAPWTHWTGFPVIDPWRVWGFNLTTRHTRHKWSKPLIFLGSENPNFCCSFRGREAFFDPSPLAGPFSPYLARDPAVPGTAAQQTYYLLQSSPNVLK
jgi:hypothetical protein